MRLVSFLFAVSTLISLGARAERLLMIGDSLSCGHFGRQVVSNWKQAGHDVTLFCAVSSRPENWLNGVNPPGQICQTMNSRTMDMRPCEPGGQIPKLDAILARNPADRIVVALGTNSLHLKTPTPAYLTMARAVRAKARCQWIGPPNLRPDQAIGWSRHKRGSAEDLQVSRDAIQLRQGNLPGFFRTLDTRIDGVCPMIDSQLVTESGPANETNDGVHKGPIGGRVWANSLLHQLASYPAAPAPTRGRGGSR